MTNNYYKLHTLNDVALQKAILKKQLATQKQYLCEQFMEIKRREYVVHKTLQFFYLGFQITNILVSLRRKRL